MSRTRNGAFGGLCHRVAENAIHLRWFFFHISFRGWLFDLKNNEAARNAFKQGEWNRARIECNGEQLRTWINDVPAADLKDGLTAQGVIALQVHGIGNKVEKAGSEIRWRNLKIKELK